MLLDKVLSLGDDDGDVGDSGGDEFTDGVLDDGLLADRQHLFRDGLGQGQQPGADTCGRNDGPADIGGHGCLLCGSSATPAGRARGRYQPASRAGARSMLAALGRRRRRPVGYDRRGGLVTYPHRPAGRHHRRTGTTLPALGTGRSECVPSQRATSRRPADLCPPRPTAVLARQLHADQGYDYACLRPWLRERGITRRIARKGVESSQRLGRHRWTVKRTTARLVGCRRLPRRHEHKADHFLAFTGIACTLSCCRRLTA